MAQQRLGRLDQNQKLLIQHGSKSVEKVINHELNDGMLEIKAESAMLGYLNAPSPFTSDGWFMTGDQVEVNGEYIKILGRKS